MPLVDPECAYDRAKRDLTNNGFSENQVQAIFIKTANSYPQCDLSGGHCLGTALLPDAYKAEQQLGNILRHLKCCTPGDLAYGLPAPLASSQLCKIKTAAI